MITEMMGKDYKFVKMRVSDIKIVAKHTTRRYYKRDRRHRNYYNINKIKLNVTESGVIEIIYSSNRIKRTTELLVEKIMETIKNYSSDALIRFMISKDVTAHVSSEGTNLAILKHNDFVVFIENDCYCCFINPYEMKGFIRGFRAGDTYPSITMIEGFDTEKIASLEDLGTNVGEDGIKETYIKYAFSKIKDGVRKSVECSCVVKNGDMYTDRRNALRLFLYVNHMKDFDNISFEIMAQDMLSDFMYLFKE